MKKLLMLFVLLFISSNIFSQTVVRTRPLSHSWTQIYADTLNGGSQTATTAVKIKPWTGSATLAIFLNKISAAAASDLAVEFQLYINGAWYGSYDDSDDESDLVTIPAAKLSNKHVYVDVTEIASWANADSVKFFFTPAAADTVVATVQFGGQ